MQGTRGEREAACHRGALAAEIFRSHNGTTGRAHRPQAHEPVVAKSIPSQEARAFLSSPLVLRIEIPHPGIDSAVLSARRRASFSGAVKLYANAAAWLVRWPHQPGEWGPTRVTAADLGVRIWNDRRPPKALVGKLTLEALQLELARWVYAEDAVRHLQIEDGLRDSGRSRLELEVLALQIDVIESPADRATRLAREEVPARPRADGSYPSDLRPGEEPPWIPDGRIWHLPVDDELEVERRPPDPNAVTPATLQPGDPGGEHAHSSSSNRSHAKEAPPPTAAELAQRHDQRSREIDMQSDAGRAFTALDAHGNMLEGRHRGRPLKGESPQIGLQGHVEAHVLAELSQAGLGDNFESMLVNTLKAVREGRLYADVAAESSPALAVGELSTSTL